MARTSNKKVTEQKVEQEPKVFENIEEIKPQMISIAFNSNNYLFGVTSEGTLYRYEPDNKKWSKA